MSTWAGELAHPAPAQQHLDHPLGDVEVGDGPWRIGRSATM